MPELPEVETVRRGLQPVLEGARLVRVEARRPDLRFPFPARFSERLTGKTITALGRRAKYLTMHVDGGPVLICHLGMSGSFRIEAADGDETPGTFHHERSKSSTHDHVVFDVETAAGARSRVIFNDPRRFGFMLFAEGVPDTHPMLTGLGVEPTGNALDGALLASLLKGRRSPLKAALLDQRLIAGLGNIYVSEALWRAGLSPLREAGTIAKAGKKASEQAERLAEAIRSVIADAIAAGGSSLRDYVQTDGSLGYFQHSFAVYDREGEPCPKPGCGGHIERIVQSGRSTFYCRTCQR
ncbi:bifunctional DNA-formamidopyrimidine glycosylase/DNA-(apurinic or apyrimidinic site) lyase [Mesorhizobium sp. M4B.F.Ca.ET.215.01.1.1]|uniref:bifunctional DNA-formamidopyrimidine glycosylase/DNA-(apurinic or apyrimidinic site) lyase n=1 Tax=unclassified Mesorhizobium TaxID=325217 RepID=UPI000FCB8F87|nr:MULTISPECIES: bifunctional DNA-formamidopyrimidine glycosylase/DNA-(apurinic or apyrimidinic site) lyase [unclassified Mesorhizobium]RUW24876.1 bifunctional DNA-formamidopyrimidine glycosylase/DNA-(apurinic or apyrimidinic site) lyase [Mesorhizobium sp. M4B.F.Ca.ET.013.02.1.1]RVD45926.1 bifunctional DNA-formamidopyrimidine glycosylase/DNA-(apurinic or apyrimidinic site) lyase [Mesorhizobium sp. M4B.F.Ca.ET.019.03.1.1]TGQ15168.1 bifunctional DNA-formamidopyrimidine glycosylase/DNA-(apurinic or